MWVFSYARCKKGCVCDMLVTEWSVILLKETSTKPHCVWEDVIRKEKDVNDREQPNVTKAE